MNLRHLAASIDPFTKAFELYATQQFNELDPKDLYAPIRYIMEVGGKRFRPICCFLGFRLWATNWTQIIPITYAIELFHNFTLLHDDIMDEATIRRGRAAGHIVYGNNAAILSGDAMLIYSFDYVLRAIEDPILANQILKIISCRAIEVCEGQQMDINFETQQAVQLEEYITMIRKKTAVLIGAAFQIGGMLAQAGETDTDYLYCYGENMGVAFQIQDDYLDAYGNESFGKRIGGDIYQRKKTLLYILALDHAKVEDRQILLSYYSQSDALTEQQVKEIYDIFGRYSIQEKVMDYCKDYSDKAAQALSKISCETQLLKAFGEQMLQRVS